MFILKKERFGERIRYTEQIKVPLDTQLPRLIIEPLVENAIRHGISKKKRRRGGHSERFEWIRRNHD